MKKYFTIIYLFFFFLIFGCNDQKPVDHNTLLKEYVSKQDPSFAYEITDTVQGDNWKEYRMRKAS